MRSFAIGLMMLATPAVAQFKLPSGIGGGLPGLDSVGAGNAAGLLGYCLRNKLLGAAGTGGRTATGTSGGAAGLLSQLTQKPGVTQSSGFALGQQGRVQQPGGGVLPLGALSGKLKARVCDLVLKRAGSFR